MKVYSFGPADRPAIVLLPGTCCHWRSNFGRVIPLLQPELRVLCVSYDGFDETERTEFPTMIEETEKLEAYLFEHCGGRIRAAYGCSLGGSFVGLLAARGCWRRGAVFTWTAAYWAARIWIRRRRLPQGFRPG